MNMSRVRRVVALVAVAGLGLAGCGDDEEEAGSQPTTSAAIASSAADATADMVDTQGRALGRVTFSEQGGRTVVDVSLRGLTPGFHGFHIHAVGKCEPPFTTAGGHLAVGDQGHPDHAGDQPVLLVLGDGTAELRFTTDRYRLSDLLSTDGRAVIVHAAADNYGNVPTRYAPAVDENTTRTGDAGDRIACGVVKGA
ncbi:MAG: superoxide dismutase family protein [Actinomycetota bacterium]|nr:superoxide dismutase family protein [Actinomycetota bacterium]